MGIQYFHRAKNEEVLSRIEVPRPGSWIVVDDPDQKEQQELIAKYGIDEDILSDALDLYESPRVEQENGIIYVITRISLPSNTSESMFTVPLTIIITEKEVLTLCRESQSDLVKKLRKIAVTTQKTQLVFHILSMVNKFYSRELTLINREVRRQTVALEKISTKDLSNLVQYERALNDYVDALEPNNATLEVILHGKVLKLYEDDKDVIEDLSLLEEQLIVRCRSLLRTIQNVRDAYSAIMNATLNDTIKKLTIVTVALTIPTMIAGLFGMNVHVPFEQSPYAFVFITLISFGIAAGAYFFIRRK